MNRPAGAAAAYQPPTAAPAPKRIASETDFYATIIEAAHLFGWRVAHFRPARTAHGWRTAVQGDGKGFPDFVLVHAGARRVWFVELKVDGAKLTLDQKIWGESLISAGAVWRTIHCPSGLDLFVADLADTVRPL